MPSYKLYKMIHVGAIVLVCMSLGGLAFHAWLGGDKVAGGRPRKLLLALHGLGMFGILLGGMGSGSQTGAISPETGFAPWIHFKFALWVLVGALPAVPYRSPRLAASLFVVVPLLVAFGAWVAGGFLPLLR
jgi:hypothetical protein